MSHGGLESTEMQKQHEREILELQKDLMMRCLDYQIQHGSDAIAWNVTINFLRQKQ